MPTLSRPFFLGFIFTLFLFLTVNVISAHVQSDCGLPAYFNTSNCADDIRRAGFPLQFYEEGGFDGRSNFDTLALTLDLVLGLALGALGGLAAGRLWKRTG